MPESYYAQLTFGFDRIKYILFAVIINVFNGILF